MYCPKCKNIAGIVDSRRYEDTVKRRHKCKTCGFSFSTREVIDDKTNKTEEDEKIRPLTNQEAAGILRDWAYRPTIIMGRSNGKTMLTLRRWEAFNKAIHLLETTPDQKGE